MEEVLVSFGTAKLAKEKGFNEECDWNYCTETYTFPTGFNAIKGNPYNFRLGVLRNACAPTQSLLQKWLREKHKIHIHVRHYSDCPEQEINNENYDESLGMYGVEISEPNTCHEMDIFVKSNFYTYEEALEIGLQEALKLIP